MLTPANYLMLLPLQSKATEVANQYIITIMAG